MAKVFFYGAAGEVTGSNFLIETGEHTYVLDCGLFQGSDVMTEQNDEPLAYDATKVEAVVVTHAHLDHIGRLPVLVKNGFRGPIFATEATIELTAITLKDALEIMQHRTEREGKAALYEEVDLKRTLDLFQPVPYHQAHPLLGSDTVTFYDAGHILGSASVVMKVGGKLIAFSGDIGHGPNVLLPHAESPIEADLVVTEATYGGVDRTAHQDRLKVIKDALNWVVERQGVLLVPAFAIERSQELLYLLNHLFSEHQLPRIPIFLDSPLAIEALAVFQRHQELFSQEVQQVRRVDKEVFNFQGLTLTPTGEDSRDINELPPPKMIIAGSGMMDGGRIHHHLKRYLSHPNTLLLVIGYQAENTIGHKIVAGAKEVEIMGDIIPVRAKIEVVDIFSGHADNAELLKWLQAIKMPSTGKIMIVHSDPERAKVYAAELSKLRPNVATHIAAIGDSVEI